MNGSKFLKYEKPPLVAMVQEETAEGAISVIVNSHAEGAEAFGIQLCYLKPEYRTEQMLKRIFDYCFGKPIYITSYRSRSSAGMSDDECAELLLLGLRAGATLCDVMGDFYHPEEDQFTFDKEAEKKQKELIKKIHDGGGEVLISTHVKRYHSESEVIALAKAQIERGADIVKIVNAKGSEEEESHGLDIVRRLKVELSKPFLYLDRTTRTPLVRRLGPIFGSCMYLCVERCLPQTAKTQPLLKSARAIRDNVLF